ncbi:MAG TPA: hypothetical protein VGN23_06055 [Verrucomicrobiae bacterium]|jgi:hypothetical protein
MIQAIFTYLLIAGFLINALHDWLDIPGWTHGRQVRAAIGPAKMIIGTAVNALLPGVAVFLALRYWNHPAPLFARIYWVVYCVMAGMGALTSWWIPYFRGTDEKTRQLYKKMYEGTIQVLPPHGDNPRPNLLHLCLHAIFVVSLPLVVILLL